MYVCVCVCVCVCASVYVFLCASESPNPSVFDHLWRFSRVRTNSTPYYSQTILTARESAGSKECRQKCTPTCGSQMVAIVMMSVNGLSLQLVL